MFISSHEKNQIHVKIQSLEIQVKNLQLQIEGLTAKQKKPATFPPEAPWGFKKDGTPKKRPGRPVEVMKVGQP
jgi:hypothetical protein